MPRKSTTKKQPAAIEYITPFICGSDISRLEYLRPKKVASPSRTSSDEDTFNPKKVKQWIVTQKALAASERKGIRQKVKGAIENLASHEAYIKNLQRYLRTGDWADDFYGEYQEEKVRHVSIALAYDEDGLVKRNVGTYYPDLGCVYTREMFALDRGER